MANGDDDIQTIELPDGRKAEFPKDMKREEIEAVLQKEFPPEKAAPPEPGKKPALGGPFTALSEKLGATSVGKDASKASEEIGPILGRENLFQGPYARLPEIAGKAFDIFRKYTGLDEGYLSGMHARMEDGKLRITPGPGESFGPVGAPRTVGEGIVGPLAMGAAEVIGGGVAGALGRGGAEEAAEATIPKVRPREPEPAVPEPVATPTATSRLDAIARQKYGMPYDMLPQELKVQVVREAGPGAPGGVERRVTPGEHPVAERRASAMPPQEEGPKGGAAPTPPAPPPKAPPSVPPAPAPTTLGGTPETPPETLRGTTETPPRRDLPLNQQPRGAPVEPLPPDPFKAEFTDPKIRQWARVNGVQVVRATLDRPQVMEAIHDLSNVEVRQAGINSGIDLGTKHVGSQKLMGEAQIRRSDLIDQMIQKGVKPEDIPGLAEPPAEKPQGRPTIGELLKGEEGGITLGRRPSPLPNIPADLAPKLQPDEIEFLKGRPILQRNIVAAYRRLVPLMDEMKNVTRAGSGLGGWWQRFMDAFDALGATTDSAEMRAAGPSHAEALKAVHSSLSGNKLVEQANKISWGVYRDWLEADRPTDVESIDAIIKHNHGMSGGVVPEAERIPGRKVANLDTQKFWQLVNSPEFQRSVPFHGNAFVGSPVEGLSEGSQKIPSMVATTAGKGNLKRVVFDTHMRDLFGMNGLGDADYIAASMHIRDVGAALGLEPGEAQEQMWGTVLALKDLMKTRKGVPGLSPRQATAAYSKDVLAATNKDYAQIILDMLNKGDKEMIQIMADLKKYGFDPGGPIAKEKLEAIAAEGAKRMAGRAQPVNRQLLLRTATRIRGMMKE